MHKNYFQYFIIIILVLTLTSCEEETTSPPPEVKYGSIFIQSNPTGAQIWVDNTNTGKVTPDSIINLSIGNHSITLKLSGFSDTTFTVTIIENTTIMSSVTFPISTQTFGPVRIWETVGTTADQPSGLDLSSGFAYGISTDDRDKVDIFYSSDGFIVTSADAGTGMTRITYFKIGSSTDLNDGIASSIKDGTWTKNIPDNTTNYVFLYDNDLHYSKIKIVNRGGGVPGIPAWIEIQWIYNKTVNDVRFP